MWARTGNVLSLESDVKGAATATAVIVRMNPVMQKDARPEGDWQSAGSAGNSHVFGRQARIRSLFFIKIHGVERRMKIWYFIYRENDDIFSFFRKRAPVKMS